MLTRPATGILALLALGCTASSGARGGLPGTPASAAPTVVPPSATSSFPADATFVDGATATVPLKAIKGSLWFGVESKRTLNGTTTTLTVSKQKDCHIDDADKQAHLFVCTTVYDRRKALPQGAFTFDGALGTASLTTTVEGVRFDVTWSGYGGTRREVNQNGNLLFEARDAKASTTWGRLQYTDRDGTDVPSSLFRRVTAAR